jgi:multisubunit Na+/H+ antiporter MnhG subunit
MPFPGPLFGAVLNLGPGGKTNDHAAYHGAILDSIKIVVVAVFVFLANPTATHAISRAAFRCGVKPWTRRENK